MPYLAVNACFFGPVEFYKKDAIAAWNRRVGEEQ